MPKIDADRGTQFEAKYEELLSRVGSDLTAILLPYRIRDFGGYYITNTVPELALDVRDRIFLNSQEDTFRRIQGLGSNLLTLSKLKTTAVAESLPHPVKMIVKIFGQLSSSFNSVITSANQMEMLPAVARVYIAKHSLPLDGTQIQEILTARDHIVKWLNQLLELFIEFEDIIGSLEDNILVGLFQTILDERNQLMAEKRETVIFMRNDDGSLQIDENGNPIEATDIQWIKLLLKIMREDLNRIISRLENSSSVTNNLKTPTQD